MINLEQLTQPELGEWARTIRRYYKLSQQEMADLIGVSRQTIISFERGVTESLPVLRGYYELCERGRYL